MSELVPQAWAAGSIFVLVRAILGIEVSARENLVQLNPTLPDWLPDIALTGLRVGNHRLNIQFSGSGAGGLDVAFGVTCGGLFRKTTRPLTLRQPKDLLQLLTPGWHSFLRRC